MMTKKTNWLSNSPIVAAAFLMATSAIGPGFLTQTAVFTNTLLASFGFVILISILLDIGAQLNIWKILGASGLRAQELANKIIPGAGYLLTTLIVIGGLAFNTGNLAGAGLGLNVLTGISNETGAIISAAIAIFIFINKESLKWMDLFAKVLGIVMILLTLYVVFVSNPPIGEALKRTFVPQKIDTMAIITLAVSAILIASTMRILLFLAALGVVSKGLSLDSSNPAASIFENAAGAIGYKIFGIIMWSAAITSVVGSAYTSISFFRSINKNFERQEKPMLIGFVLIALIVFLLVGKPVNILVVVGALNGFILPIALTLVLLGSLNKRIIGEYKHPKWLIAFGIVVVVATLYLSVATVMQL